MFVAKRGGNRLASQRLKTSRNQTRRQGVMMLGAKRTALVSSRYPDRRAMAGAAFYPTTLIQRNSQPCSFPWRGRGAFPAAQTIAAVKPSYYPAARSDLLPRYIFAPFKQHHRSFLEREAYRKADSKFNPTTIRKAEAGPKPPEHNHFIIKLEEINK